MARRHGWQLPAHSFQVVAIIVFFLMSIAFYAIFAPFLEKDIYKYVAFAVYGILEISVFMLYVRCTAIDPADPGILISCHRGLTYKSQKDEVSLEEPSKIGLKTEEKSTKHKSSTCTDIGYFLCAFMVKEDCCKNENTAHQQASSEEALFCTLCNAEVRKFSKHCRSCDKCVDGFDHHCRWLNNCIGRKNYVTFLFLMGMSIAWLAVECGVGIAVLVRCFTEKRATEIRISERLGDGFSRVLFATIVAIFTSLSFLATIPLGELFFFHMILIRKGITTYEYVVAMRTQSEPPGPSVNEDPQSLPSSPMSSIATAISGSSLGVQYRGAWCTPPRIFVDQKDEIIPHLEPGRVPSTVDPDSINLSEGGGKQPKRPVRISAWKLAKLDSNEAVKAAAKARASSSVLKPINSRSQYEADRFSTGNISSQGSTTTDTGPPETQAGILRSLPLKCSYPPSRVSREDLESNPHTPNSVSSPHRGVTAGNRHVNPICQTSMSRSPWSNKMNDFENSSASRAIDNGRSRNITNTVGNLRSSVYWDQEAGRFMSSQNSTELLYTGHSIFYGGPLLGGSSERCGRSFGSSSQPQQSGGMERGRGSQQLPVFAPRDSEDHLPKLP